MGGGGAKWLRPHWHEPMISVLPSISISMTSKSLEGRGNPPGGAFRSQSPNGYHNNERTCNQAQIRFEFEWVSCLNPSFFCMIDWQIIGRLKADSGERAGSSAESLWIRWFFDRVLQRIHLLLPALPSLAHFDTLSTDSRNREGKRQGETERANEWTFYFRG